MTGSRSLSWRYACPADRHRGLKRSGDSVYCQTCDREFQACIDLKDDVAVPPAEALS